VLVDRAAAQLEVDEDVLGDGRGGRSGSASSDLGVGVHRRGVGGRVGAAVRAGEVAQRLDAAGGGAGADHDELAGLLADLADALGVVRGGDRALDQRDVVGPSTVALEASRK
jgi:hypothetical protein